MRKRHHRVYRKSRPPRGANPGTLAIPPGASPPRIHLLQYNAESFEESDISDVRSLHKRLRDDAVTWVDVQGLGDEKILRELGELFSIHPLALEDVVHIPQQPKTESFEHHQYIVFRELRLTATQELEAEQISVFVGKNYVLTFQERYGDLYEPIRNRIRRNAPIRRFGPDFLGYALIDATIDGYFPVVEELGEQIESLEDAMLHRPGAERIGQLQDIKRKLLTLRRVVWPQREALNALIRDDTPMVGDPVCVYLRDCLDHCVQLIDVLETYREMASSLTDIYLSSLAHRQNEVMKVLTIMASVFIPLTLLSGIYGMNFDYMPELRWTWGYPALLLVMVALATAMLAYFRWAGWWGKPPRNDVPNHEPLESPENAISAPRHG